MTCFLNGAEKLKFCIKLCCLDSINQIYVEKKIDTSKVFLLFPAFENNS